MTTLYLLTPGLFVDKPFCQNVLVKGRESGCSGGARGGLDLVSAGIQAAPPTPAPSVTNQPPNGQQTPLGMGIWQGLSELSGCLILPFLPWERNRSVGYFEDKSRNHSEKLLRHEQGRRLNPLYKKISGWRKQVQAKCAVYLGAVGIASGELSTVKDSLAFCLSPRFPITPAAVN